MSHKCIVIPQALLTSDYQNHQAYIDSCFGINAQNKAWHTESEVHYNHKVKLTSPDDWRSTPEKLRSHRE